jgi:hypothetical protein
VPQRRCCGQLGHRLEFGQGVFPVRAGGFSFVAHGGFCSVYFLTYVFRKLLAPETSPISPFSFRKTRSVSGRKKKGFRKYISGISGITEKLL